jgi:hypothetical protein
MIDRDSRADIATAHSFFPNAIRRIGGIRKATAFVKSTAFAMPTVRLFAERGRVEHLALGFDFLHVVGFGQR